MGVLRAAYWVGPLSAVLLLAGCQTDGPSFVPSAGKAGFRDNYSVARAALEKGQYGKAERGYANILRKSGPLEPRIRLEYAHLLLRKGDYTQAAAQAGSLAQSQKGEARGAALAVQATAEHEMALKLSAQGDRVQAKKYLVKADRGMAEVLKKYPKLDPIGSLAARRASIKVRKAAL